MSGRQRGQVLLLLMIAVVVIFFVGLFAICTPGEDDHSLGRLQLVSARHRCDHRRDCGDDGRDKRTCFFGCDNVIVVPGLPGSGGGQDQPPPDDRPRSLVPPTPDKVIGGIQTMADAGINLGTTISRLVIDYVVTVLRFVV